MSLAAVDVRRVVEHDPRASGRAQDERGEQRPEPQIRPAAAAT